jgi:uncharacterized membrane protein
MKSLLQKFVNQWALNKSETATRSFVKAYSYRFCGTFTTMLISYAFTGEWIVSLSIGATEMVVKPFIYWCHERVWNGIGWGRI